MLLRDGVTVSDNIQLLNQEKDKTHEFMIK